MTDENDDIGIIDSFLKEQALYEDGMDPAQKRKIYDIFQESKQSAINEDRQRKGFGMPSSPAHEPLNKQSPTSIFDQQTSEGAEAPPRSRRKKITIIQHSSSSSDSPDNADFRIEPIEEIFLKDHRPPVIEKPENKLAAFAHEDYETSARRIDAILTACNKLSAQAYE